MAEKKRDRKVEITKKGHLFNGVECKGGEQFDVTEETLKRLVADNIGKDVTPKPETKPAAAK